MMRLNRNVWLLFICQALVNSTNISQVSISALIGYSLAGEKTMATVPYALQMASMMLASIPAGMIFGRFGRRTGFYFGTCATILGVILLSTAIWQSNFLLFCIGSVPMGIGFGIGQHYRFAAAEVAGAADRSRAIALVMVGGVVAAILGPEMVKATKEAMGPILFLGTYVAMGLLPLIAMAILAVVALPPAPPKVATPTPVLEILARPAFITAVVAGLVSYGTMNIIMAATPLEMMLCGFGVNDSTDVIRTHAIAMFAPGFVTGRLIDKWGAHKVILIGGVLNLACVAIAVSGSTFMTFTVALMVLGLGWNFMFVGASALLATAHEPHERVRTQAANDFIVFTTVAITSFSSGALHAAKGWGVVNAAVILPVLVAMALVGWHLVRQSRQLRATA